MRKIFLFVLYLFSCSILFAQTTVLDSLLEELSLAKEDTAKMRLLRDLAAESHHVNPQKTIDYSMQELELAEKYQDKDHLAVSNYMIGAGNFYLGNMELALEYALKSLRYSEELQKPEFLVDCYNFIGALYQHLNNYPQSLEYLLKSLQISEEHNMRDGIATASGNIADIYVQLNDLVKGREYYEKALLYFNAPGDELFRAMIYNNMAESLIASPDTSIQYLLQSLEIFKKNNAEDGMAHASNNLGKKHALKEDYLTAIQYFKNAITIWEKPDLNFLPGLADVYTALGAAYGHLGKGPEAERFLEKALVLGKENNFKERLKETYLVIFELAEENNEPAKALAAYKEAMILKDSLLNADKSKELANYEVLYQTGQKERELIEAQLKIAKQSNIQNRILLGAAIVIFLLLGLFQYIRSRQRLKRKETELALQLEKAEAGKLRELDRVKSTFFANISHEFRTPITLIVSPLDQLINGTLKGDPEKYFRIMRRNGQRLLDLVNQLLDLSKLEAGKMTLHLEEKDLTKQVRALAHSFESVAGRKNIAYSVTAPEESLIAHFDPDKLEKIITNLLSNAFKFTPEDGKIAFRLSQEQGQILIEVSDTGIGIPEEELPNIFERFYHSSNRSDLQVNSGIGLSLIAELVKLHDGQIEVESEKDKGTTFKVLLPLEIVRQSASLETNATLQMATVPLVTAMTEQLETITSSGTTQILIVEDNLDVRTYIVDQLKEDYRILEAENGAIGLELALQNSPDLIITDVMMPIKNGIELCNDLKSNPVTSHIPVIMLTAKAEQEDKIEGLETGADDYLLKPFDTKELRLRIRNLIEQQRRLQKKYSQFVQLKPTEVEAQSVDEKFLTEIHQIIEEHLDDEQFSVIDLSGNIGLSRSQLHRKLKALTGKSPNAIIRSMRLERAKQLLEQNAGNASEVTYMVGFSSSAYFAKCFRDEFGMSPTEVKTGKK